MKNKIHADKITEYIICAVFALIFLAIFIPLFANVLGFGYELEQLKNSLFKGYCYAEDNAIGGYEKVIYHGTLKELATKEKQQYNRFMDWAEWYIDYEANETKDIGRVECEDYIVAHHEFKYRGTYGHGGWKTYFTSLPQNVTYYGSADEYDVEFLVFNRDTGEVLGFDSWSAVNKWLGVS